jgi:hypothetical protein
MARDRGTFYAWELILVAAANYTPPPHEWGSTTSGGRWRVVDLQSVVAILTDVFK